MELARHYTRPNIWNQPAARRTVDLAKAPFPLVGRNLRAGVVEPFRKLREYRFG
jgi:hypothetical protein